MSEFTVYGPFKQILTLDRMPLKGPLSDEELHLIENAGILVCEGRIVEIAPFPQLKAKAIQENYSIVSIEGDFVLMPGFIDAHTHICYAGTRSVDYSNRLKGMSYQDIAVNGGGIWSTVTQTRNATEAMLLSNTFGRANTMFANGVTTAEVKSGYELTTEGEIRMLEVIKKANDVSEIDLIPTCLAAHFLPHDFKGSESEYLQEVVKQLLPVVKERNLSTRVDIFIDEGAFPMEESLTYLRKAKQMGFDIVVHADQFTTGGSYVAANIGALSADHLEASSDAQIELLVKANVIPVCLPGASLGLGMEFAPARKILNAGANLAIASDWNPGSAPMGDLLVQASILGAAQKLTNAETFAAITFRAAAALNLHDRGVLKKGALADMVAFPVKDYRDILYNQGMLKPSYIWKKGKFNTKT